MNSNKKNNDIENPADLTLPEPLKNDWPTFDFSQPVLPSDDVEVSAGEKAEAAQVFEQVFGHVEEVAIAETTALPTFDFSEPLPEFPQIDLPALPTNLDPQNGKLDTTVFGQEETVVADTWQGDVFAKLDLPRLDLPEVPNQEAKRRMTLVADDVGDLLRQYEVKHHRWPWVLLGILALGGIGAYGMRDALVEHFAPKPVVVAEQPTPADLADEAFVAGVKAYQANDLNQAVSLLQKAIEQQPNMAKAYRSLAIAHAARNEQEKAVELYRRYLSLAPDAADAADVRKIISDYEGR